MKLFVISLITLFFSINLFSQQELKLEEAIKIALQKNTSLISTENELQRSESSLKAAYGNFLPTLGAYGTWGWDRSEETGRTTTVNGAIVPVAASNTETRTYGVGATSSIVLFDGLSNFATLSKNQNNLEAVKYSIEQKKQEVVFQTTQLLRQDSCLK